MELGLALSVQHRPEDSQAARFAEHVEQVRLARAVGFASVWASQHYLSDPFTYFQPLPTLGRMAAEAEGMRLACCCCRCTSRWTWPSSSPRST
jgi:alkanesulfonate monooxygenase SsuD/methylene tetrahydromethanopterin reductase-like flavin-dependent oxidoreductase (luciferase family)